EAHDYRYFTDPDLVPLRITTEMVEEARKSLPELSADKHKRFMEEYGLSDYDAGVLTADKATATDFEVASQTLVDDGFRKKDIGKELCHWITVDLRGLQNKFNLPKFAGTTSVHSVEKPASQEEVSWVQITHEGVPQLFKMKQRGEISGPIAKSVLEEMFTTGKSAAEIVKAKGLTQVSDEGALEKIIDEVMAKNPQQLAQYRSGKEAVFGFFVGQVMKASGGKANPAKVNELLKKKLAC
ncbi:MAG: Asp-tRNA(Asn)/Glu-tRNA(Gln) amidotransferase GatCAB subunit B, partial [Nitrospiraceae bacterium]